MIFHNYSMTLQINISVAVVTLGDLVDSGIDFLRNYISYDRFIITTGSPDSAKEFGKTGSSCHACS